MSKQELTRSFSAAEGDLQDPSAGKFVIKRIEPVGNRLIKSRELEKVTERFLFVDLSYEDLLQIKAAIENHYARQNLVAVVLIPSQDLRSDVLRLELVESAMTDKELYRALSQVKHRTLQVP